MYDGILSICDIDCMINNITFEHDSLVCHKFFGIGTILHKDTQTKIKPIFANNYWFVLLDKPQNNGIFIVRIRADELHSINTKNEAKNYNWDKHFENLSNNFRAQIC